MINSGGSAISGVDVRLTFNTEQLRLISIQQGRLSLKTFVPDIGQLPVNANQSGIIEFSALAWDGQNLTSAFTSTSAQLLATLTFTPLAIGSASVKWDVANSHLVSDSAVPQDVLSTTTDLDIDIAAAATSAPP